MRRRAVALRRIVFLMAQHSRRISLVLGLAGLALLIAGVGLYVRQVRLHTAAPAPAASATPAIPVDLKATLPFDTAISTGTLPNGLTYFVRANKQPEHRAELRLVVNAGSVLEDDDQRGVAHFVEHMAFNGTKRFPQHQVGDFLESVGMRFGPGINATTGYDETVYRVQIPTDQPGVLDRSLTILEDWAHQVTFDPVEVAKERPVILEEWRARRGAGARVNDEVFPLLVKGSRYADRLPIGTPESITPFRIERLRQFYADWYRPDLMAVIAVGDFDQAAVAAQIAKQFATIPAPQTPRPRPVITVPAQPGTAFVVSADNEITQTSLSIVNRKPAEESTTVAGYRHDTIQRLMNDMMSLRLAEIAQAPNGPMLQAQALEAPVVRTLHMTSLAASVKNGQIEPALRALALERVRLARFGFTEPELERQKSATLRSFERAIAEKSRQSSDALAAEYIRHFTTGEPVPGLQWEFDTTSKLLTGITLADVNQAAQNWLPDDNRVVIAGIPKRAGAAIPTEASLTAALRAAATLEVRPWVVRATSDSLLETEPKPGAITATNVKAGIGVTEWTLSNGARVVLLPTTFQQDQIVFSAISSGGLSLASEDELVPAQTATQVVNTMGFGRFGSGDLRRWLTGHAVSVQPVIGPFESGLSGGSSKPDLETLFQWIHLAMTAPRRDPVIFEAVRAQMKEALANQAASPDYAFAQMMSATMTQGHPRAKPMAAESIPKMDLDKSLAFYKARFADASAFTFVFVGSFDIATMKPLVEKYLASLPATHRGETWRDVGVRPPRGVVTRTVDRGVEPKSRTIMLFTGETKADRANAVAIVALAEVLQLRLSDALREELGGTYTASVGSNVSRVPIPQYTISVDFTSDPARADALATRVLEEIAKLKASGPSEQHVNDVRAALQRDFETSVRQNGFLVSQLAQRYQTGEAPETLWHMPEMYKALTPQVIRDTARATLDPNNYVKVVLRPQAGQPGK
jgi:zinc protease